MDVSPTPAILLRLLLVLILLPLLGLAPRSHRVETDLQAARQAVSEGDLNTAAQRVAQAAGRWPARPDLWEQAGGYALQAGRPSLAIENLKAAQAAGRLSPQGWLWLGDAYGQGGDFEAASQAWQAALKNGAPLPDLYRRLVVLYRRQGNYDLAIRDLQTLVRLQPNDASLRYQLGLLLTVQDPSSGLATLAQAAQLDPKLSPAVDALRGTILALPAGAQPAYTLLVTGRGLAGVDEWDLAAAAFRKAATVQPSYGEAWAYLGEACQHLSPAEAAGPCKGSDGLAELRLALALNPDSVAAHTFLALYWNRQGRYNLAIDALRQAAARDPSNPVLQAELGRNLATNGDLTQAAEAYRTAVTLAPNDSAYLRLLAGFALKYEYQLDTLALPALRQALNLAPNDPQNLDLMGQVLMQQNDLLSAQRFFERAVQVNAKYAPAHLHLGMAFLQQGDKQSAQRELEQAIGLDPDGPASEQARKLLEQAGP